MKCTEEKQWFWLQGLCSDATGAQCRDSSGAQNVFLALCWALSKIRKISSTKTEACKCPPSPPQFQHLTRQKLQARLGKVLLETSTVSPATPQPCLCFPHQLRLPWTPDCWPCLLESLPTSDLTFFQTAKPPRLDVMRCVWRGISITPSSYPLLFSFHRGGCACGAGRGRLYWYRNHRLLP